jgi:hypothetical protein
VPDRLPVRRRSRRNRPVLAMSPEPKIHINTAQFTFSRAIAGFYSLLML